MGYLLLEGGAEFGGRMRDPDLKAIELAGGPESPIRIIPTRITSWGIDAAAFGPPHGRTVGEPQ